ncbi:DUF4190 domain-containing protein [Streptomyces sp. YIM S03343]
MPGGATAPPPFPRPGGPGLPLYGPPAPYNPFAPPPPAVFAPASPRDEPVPPPPIAPDGPGQVPYGYPGGPGGYGHPYGSWPGLQPPPSNGTGTAGLVIGVPAALVWWLWPLSILLGGVAVTLGALGRQKARCGEASNGTQALVAVVLGAVGIVLGLVRVAYLIAT